MPRELACAGGLVWLGQCWCFGGSTPAHWDLGPEGWASGAGLLLLVGARGWESRVLDCGVVCPDQL